MLNKVRHGLKSCPAPGLGTHPVLQLHVFFSETVRIAQAISEGNLQVQAEVHAVEGDSSADAAARADAWHAGVWAQIVTEVNKMSTTLSSQVSQFQAIVGHSPIRIRREV